MEIKLGSMVFDLGVNMGRFVSNLSGAGSSVAGFSKKVTDGFAGSKQVFAQYNQELRTSQGILTQQQAGVQRLSVEQKQLTDAILQQNYALLSHEQQQGRVKLGMDVAITQRDTYRKKLAEEANFSRQYAATLEQLQLTMAKVTEKTERSKNIIAAFDGEIGNIRTAFRAAASEQQQYQQEQIRLTARVADETDAHKQLIAILDIEKQKLADLRAERAAGGAVTPQDVERQRSIVRRTGARVTTAQARIDTTSVDLGTTNAALADAQTRARAIVAQMATVRTARQQEIASIKANDAALTDLSNKEQIAITELHQHTDAAQKLNDQYITSREVVNAAALGLTKQDALIDATKTKIGQYSDQLKSADQALVTLTGSMQQQEAAVTALTAKVATAPGGFKRFLDTVNQVATVSKSSFDAASKVTTSFLTSWERMTRGIRDASPQLVRAQEEVYRLRTRIASQTSTVELARKTYEGYANHIAARQAEIAKQESLIVTRMTATKELRAQLVVEEEKLARAMGVASDAEVAKLRAVIETTKAEITTKEHAVAVSEHWLAQQQDQLARLHVEQEQAKADSLGAANTLVRLNEGYKLAVAKVKELSAAHKDEVAAKKQSTAASKDKTEALFREAGEHTRLIDRIIALFFNTQKASASNREFNLTMNQMGTSSMSASAGLGHVSSFLRDVAAYFVGGVLVTGFQRLIGDTKQLSSSGIQTSASFDQLKFSINGLLAREDRLTNTTETFAEAMKNTEGATVDVVGKIEQLGITSTYTSSELTGMYQTLLQSFGSQESLHIMGQISQFGDVMGKSAADITGVADLLDKIKNRGKVSLQEINELQGRNVTALDYLAKAYGKTNEEILGMISAGEILSDKAIPAIVDGLRNDFAGAGDIASNTISGLTSSIRDLADRALRVTFTPILKALQPYLIQFVGILTNPALVAALTDIGNGLGGLVTNALAGLVQVLPRVIQFFEDLVPSVETGIATIVAFGEQLSGMAADAYDWGSGLLSSFLDGFMSQFSQVENVVSGLADELASWMEPHSPPKMLPKIDQWGQQTGQVYFDGMANADPTGAVQDLAGRANPGEPASNAPVPGNGLAGVAGQSGGASLSTTNSILTSIGQTMQALLNHFTGSATGSAAPSSTRSAGGASGPSVPGKKGGVTQIGGSGLNASDLPPGVVPGSAEYYRILNEKQLAGAGQAATSNSGTRTAVANKEQAAAKAAFDAELKNAEATGNYGKALDMLKEKLTGVTEGSKEYFDTQTQIQTLEARLQKQQETKAKAAENAQKREEAKAAAEAKRAAAKADADEKAQINYLIKTGDTAKALELLQARLSRVAEGSKEYYSIQLQIAKLQKGKGGGESGMHFAGFEPQNKPPQGLSPDERGEKPLSIVAKTMAAIQARMKEAVARVQTFFAPIQAFLEKYSGYIGYVLTGIALAIGRFFIITRVLPLVREFAVFLGLVGRSALTMLMPFNLLRLAIGLFAIAWLRDIGGVRAIFTKMWDDIQPMLQNLLALVTDIFGSGGIPEQFEKLKARLPELRDQLQVLFAHIGQAFVDWLVPLRQQMITGAQGMLTNFAAWMRARGGGVIVDTLKRWLVDVQAWWGSQDPKTLIYGVVLRLATFTLGITEILLASVLAAAVGLIVAYGPIIGAQIQLWGLQFGAWLQDALPVFGRTFGIFTGVMLAGLATGLLLLIRQLGVWTLQLAGWILPAVPLVLSTLLDFVMTIATWFVAVGAYQLIDTLQTWISTALDQVGQKLPEIGFNFGQVLGRVLVQAIGVAVAALAGAALWLPKIVGWFKNEMFPKIVAGIIGLGKGLVGILGGVIVGAITPLADVLTVGATIERVIKAVSVFFRNLGVISVSNFLDGLHIELPGILKVILGVLDGLTYKIKDALGIATEADRARALVARYEAQVGSVDGILQGLTNTLKTVIPVLGGVGLAVVGVVLAQNGWLVGLTRIGPFFTTLISGARTGGSMLLSLAGSFRALGTTIITTTLPALRTFVVSVGTTALNALRGLATFMMTTVLGAVRAMAVALIEFASASIQGSLGVAIGLIIQRLGDFVIAIRTTTIPAIIDMAKALIADAGIALRGFITIIMTEGIPGLIALARQGIVSTIAALTGMVTGLNVTAAAMRAFTLSAGAVGLAIAAIAYAISRWNEFSERIKTGTQAILDSRQWWRDSAKAMLEFANASETTKEKVQSQAEAVQGLREEIQNDIDEHAKHSAAYQAFNILSGQTTDSLQKEQNAINSKADRLKAATHDLKAAIDAEDTNKTVLSAATDAYGKLQPKIAKTADDYKQLASAVNHATDEGIRVLDELTGSQNTFMADREQAMRAHQATLAGLAKEGASAQTSDEKIAIGERIAAEQANFAEQEQTAALAYVKERQAQKAHLGQMLIEYVQSQSALNKTAPDKTAELVDKIAKQYGVQQSVSEKTFLSMRKDIDGYLTSAGGNIDDVVKKLGENSTALTNNKKLADDLAKQYTMEIVQKFQKQGKYDPQELQDALDKVPQMIEVTIRTKLDDKTGLLGTDGTKTIVEDRAERQGKAIGGASGSGMRTGIKDELPATVDAAGATADAVAAETRKKLGIRSPSTVFAAIGKHVMSGFGGGMLEGMQPLVQTTGATMQQLIRAAPTDRLAGPASQPLQRASGGMQVSIPVTISGNTVRSDADLHQLEARITGNFITALDTLVQQGFKG